MQKKFTKEDLIQRLTPIQYQVTQEKGTERPWTGEYNKHYEDGNYMCIVCDTPLFESGQKFDSGCGWPAFAKANTSNVEEHVDNSYGMKRTEVTCRSCGAHLGHVFNDGPKNMGGLRYCINSASVNFKGK